MAAKEKKQYLETLRWSLSCMQQAHTKMVESMAEYRDPAVLEISEAQAKLYSKFTERYQLLKKEFSGE